MKAKKIVRMTGAVICAILTIMFRTAALPASLVYDALDAMANNTDEKANNLMSEKETA